VKPSSPPQTTQEDEDRALARALAESEREEQNRRRRQVCLLLDTVLQLLNDWLKKHPPLFDPIRNKKTKRIRIHIPALSSTYNYLEF